MEGTNQDLIKNISNTLKVEQVNNKTIGLACWNAAGCQKLNGMRSELTGFHLRLRIHDPRSPTEAGFLLSNHFACHVEVHAEGH